MEKTDIVIIGAGVVGLAIAEHLSGRGREVVVLERHDSFGQETSSRNSEVIHAGFYYPPGSLKARLCVEGNRFLYAFCRDHEVPHRRCGKLLVAQAGKEETKLRELFRQGTDNGVEGLTLIDKKGIAGLESVVAGDFGMLSLSTGILDTHVLMKRLERLTMDHGAIVAYGCEVMALSCVNGGYAMTVRDADGMIMTLQGERVINAAGLSADRIADLAGIDTQRARYGIRYCKGEYFSVSPRHRGKLSHLVYPVPTGVSLGVHGVLSLDGSLKLGPNAFFVDTIDYGVDAGHRRDFFNAGRLLFPFIEEDDLSPAMAGIRPKLERVGDEFRDFVIREENDSGLPGFFNLVGIESPGLTSALAIARYVGELVK